MDMTVMNLMRNGGQMVNDVEEIKEQVGVVIGENTVLKSIIEKQGAVIVAIKDELGVMSRKIDSMQDEVTYNKKTTDEIKHVKFVGQTTELLPTALERAKKMTNKQIRRLIHRAARSHKGGWQKGYTHIYVRFEEATGINLYDEGKTVLKKSDEIEGWVKDPSYINTILKKDKQLEAAAVCMQIVADS